MVVDNERYTIDGFDADSVGIDDAAAAAQYGWQVMYERAFPVPWADELLDMIERNFRNKFFNKESSVLQSSVVANSQTLSLVLANNGAFEFDNEYSAIVESVITRFKEKKITKPRSYAETIKAQKAARESSSSSLNKSTDNNKPKKPKRKRGKKKDGDEYDHDNDEYDDTDEHDDNDENSNEVEQQQTAEEQQQSDDSDSIDQSGGDEAASATDDSTDTQDTGETNTSSTTSSPSVRARPVPVARSMSQPNPNPNPNSNTAMHCNRAKCH
jgi:hypothetical protein